MKKINQRGSIDFIFIFTVIIIAVVGYFVYAQLGLTDKTVHETTTDSVKSSQSTIDNDRSNEAVITDLDEAIVLETVSDIAQLEGITPNSFNDYLSKRIAELNDGTNQDCLYGWSISIISAVNIAGGFGDCGFGGKSVYSLVDGVWQETFFQAPGACDEIIKKRIFAEFSPTCLDANNNDVPNPNGKIPRS